MKLNDYLSHNKYSLMPAEEKTNLKKKYFKDRFAEHLGSLPDDQAKGFLAKADARFKEIESEYLNANMGPQLPVDKQKDMTTKQKKLYQTKIVEDVKREQLESGKIGSFTDYASKMYNAISNDIGNNPENVLHIANLLNPALMADSLNYFGAASTGARRQQALEYTEVTGKNTLPATKFPDVLLNEGIKQSGPGRLIETYSPENRRSYLQGKRREVKGPEFQPEGMGGRILYGIGSILPDLPFFLSGPIQGFAASKMISSYADAREKVIKTGNPIDFGDTLDVATEGLKGGILGAALTLVGIPLNFLNAKIGSAIGNSLLSKGLPVTAKISEKIASTLTTQASTAIEAGGMITAEHLLNIALPTTDDQKKSVLDLSPDKVLEAYILFGLMKASGKLGAAFGKTAKESGTKLSAVKKLKEIGTDINKFSTGAEENIKSQIISERIKKSFTPDEIRDIAETTGRKPEEVIKSSPEEFKKISAEYLKDSSKIVYDHIAESFAELDQSTGKFQSRLTEQRVKEEFSPGVRKANKVIEDKYQAMDEFVGDSVISTKEFKPKNVITEKFDLIYGTKGSRATQYSLEDVRDFLSGNSDKINKGIENGNEVVSIQTEVKGKKNPATGDIEKPTRETLIPVTKGEFNAMKEMKNLSAAPIIGKFFNFSKQVRSMLGDKATEIFVESKRSSSNMAEKDYVSDRNFTLSFWKKFSPTRAEKKNVWRKLVLDQFTGEQTLRQMKQLDKVSELTPREESLYQFFRERFIEKGNIHNEARILSGLEPMTLIENYFPMMRRFTMGEKLGVRNKGKGISDDVFIEEMLARDSASFAKTRVYTNRAVDSDLLGTYLKYSKEFHKSTYEMPVIAKMKKLINPIKTVGGEKFWLKNSAPETYEFLKSGIEFMEGIPQYKNTVLNNVLKTLQKNLGRSILGANYNSVFSQAGASWGLLTEMPKQALTSAHKMLNPMEIKEAFEQSRHLGSRKMDVSYTDAVGSPMLTVRSAIQHPVDTVTKTIFAPMRVVDVFFATWSFITARDAALKKGMSMKEAIKFADNKTIDWNASAASEDLSALQRTPAFKMISIFQTHPINQINWIMRDIVGVKLKEVEHGGNRIRPGGTKKKLDFSDSMFTNPKKALLFVSSLGVATGINEIYKEFGLYSPISSPVTAFFSKDKDGEDIPIDRAIGNAFIAFASAIPIIGGIPQWGFSSAAGAGASEMVKFLDALKETMTGNKQNQELRVAQQLGVLVGVPAIKPMLREYRKFKKRQKEIEKMSDPKAQYKEMMKASNKVFREMKKYRTEGW